MVFLQAAAKGRIVSDVRRLGMDEQQYLLLNQARTSFTSVENATDEEWSEGSSETETSSCTDTDCESSDPEWETFIEPNGQLLFIDCHPFVTQTHSEQGQPAVEETKKSLKLSKNSSMRKSTRSKFLRLIRRRDSKRKSKRILKTEQGAETKVKFHDYNEGEVKIVILQLTPQPKFGRRAKLSENVLGINVSAFTDGSRIMVAGILPNGPAKRDKGIKIGDWLKSINDVNVTSANLTETLERFETNFEIKLELQRVTGVEVTKQPPSSEISNQTTFVKQLTTITSNETLQLLLVDQPVGILYLDTENVSESGPEFQGVLYCYPNPMENNILCINRGVFITLNHLLREVTKGTPKVTSIGVKGRLVHVVYYSELEETAETRGKVLLMMLPDNRVSRDEVVLLAQEVVRTLKFVYGSVEKCFAPKEADDGTKVEVDHFFSRFFARVLTSGLWNKAEQSVVLNSLPSKALLQAPFQFEGVMPSAHLISLPSEAKMQIDDALTELEASDYREWNEDPLDCQRLFTILGSALYHSGYLIASHLIHQDLIDVHLYCRQQGLFHLSQTEPVRSMVLWREVFPYSCNREPKCGFLLPDGARHYLLVVGSGKDLLVLIMEAGGCTEPPEDNLPPDAFYVEEAQATLAHLQELGIGELAQRWIQTNPGSQVTIPQLPVQKRRSETFLGTLGPLSGFKGSATQNDNSSKGGNTNLNKTSTKDLTSILKRRSNDHLTHLGGSGNVFDDLDAQSESSTGNNSEKSEVSDEPILGRRAQREKFYSDAEESDVDDYRDGSQISQSSFDISELRQSLLAQAGDAQPLPLTVSPSAGDLVLYHYVQLDSTEGILLGPPECVIESKTLEGVLNNFRKAAQNMHKLFQNTLRFKNMPPEEMSTSLINKSLVAIKEHGVLFEIAYQDEMNVKKTPPKIAYWVIGRLFFTPHPRELYVCYQNSVPQNMIEIAFKLGISSAI